MLGAALLLLLFDPETTRWFPSCPFFVTTGLHCPGCGSLRAGHQLLQGNFLAALAFNPLAVMGGPVLVAMMFNPKWATKPNFAWACLFILILYGILRNIPVWPFALLAPA